MIYGQLVGFLIDFIVTLKWLDKFLFTFQPSLTLHTHVSQHFCLLSWIEILEHQGIEPQTAPNSYLGSWLSIQPQAYIYNAHFESCRRPRTKIVFFFNLLMSGMCNCEAMDIRMTTVKNFCSFVFSYEYIQCLFGVLKQDKLKLGNDVDVVSVI